MAFTRTRRDACAAGEGVPRQLAGVLRKLGFEAVVFTNEWKQLGDSELLDRALSEPFDVLITADRNTPFQQNLGSRDIAVLVLSGVDRKKVGLYGSHIAAALGEIIPGTFHYLGKDGQLVSERPS